MAMTVPEAIESGRIAALCEEVEASPLRVPPGVMEQYEAAAKEGIQRLQRATALPGVGPAIEGSGGDTLLRLAALFYLATAQRGRIRACPHVGMEDLLTHPRPIYVLLSPRLACCLACLSGAGAHEADGDTDGLCDFCQRPTPGPDFEVLLLGIGPITLQGEFCEVCAGGVRTLVAP